MQCVYLCLHLAGSPDVDLYLLGENSCYEKLISATMSSTASLFLKTLLMKLVMVTDVIFKNVPFGTAWIDLESIMLSEVSQVVKDKYPMISPVSGT